MVSGPQRLQPCAWTAPDLSTTAPALDSAARRRRLPKNLFEDLLVACEQFFDVLRKHINFEVDFVAGLAEA